MASKKYLIVCDKEYRDIKEMDTLLVKKANTTNTKFYLFFNENDTIKDHFENSGLYKDRMEYTTLDNVTPEQFELIYCFYTKATDTKLFESSTKKIRKIVSSARPKYQHFKETPNTSVKEICSFMGLQNTMEKKIHKKYKQRKLKIKQKRSKPQKKPASLTTKCQLEVEEYE
jgi:hypothetical protein